MSVMTENATFLSESKITDSQESIGENISWAFECVLTLLVSPFGVIFNVLALYLLVSTHLFKSFFNKLLACMAIFDILYLILSISEAIRQFVIKTCIHDYIFVIIVYPLRSILMCCSIYTTLELAFERYNNVCKPIANFQNRGNQLRNNEWKRVAKNIVPVIVFSFLFYLPKFFELKTTDCELQCPFIYTNNNTDCMRQRINKTELRRDPYYVMWYINVANDLCTWVIPFVVLSYLNICIYVRLRQYLHAKFSRFKQGAKMDEGNPSDLHQAIVLFSIVTLFFICHAIRATLNIAELIDLIERRFSSDAKGHNTLQFWARILYPISHFLLKFNASVNFFIYLACDKMFRRVMVDKIPFLGRSSDQNNIIQENGNLLSESKDCPLIIDKKTQLHSIETRKTELSKKIKDGGNI